MTVIYFLLMMLPIVIIHELGHFYIGKWMGIPPQVFSVGFGPELYSRTAKDGTIWRFAALPLGGYVKFKPDVNGTEFPNLQADKGFYSYRFRARILTLLAGPFANFLLSIILFFAYYAAYGPQGDEAVVERVHAVASELETGDRIVSIEGQVVTSYSDIYTLTEDAGAQISATVERDGERVRQSIPNPNLAVVMAVLPDGQAFDAGLEAGDQIVAYGAETVTTMNDLRSLLDEFGETTQTMIVMREGEPVSLTITPKRAEGDLETATPKVGFYSGFYEAKHVPLSIARSAQVSVASTFGILTMSFDGIKDMITGQVSLKALSGPVGMARMASDSADSGFWSFVQFMAVISSAIGFLNLLPIPILDGGHIVLQTYEKIAGRLPPQAVVNTLFALGFGLLIGLMSLATFQDLLG